MHSTTMVRIGGLAAEFGVHPKTIRYYEQIGLLPQPERTEAGYRVYAGSDRDRLHFITKAKTIGLTLSEIADILSLRDRGDQPCDQVVELLDRKLAAVDRQMRLLADFRRELVTLRAEAAGSRAAQACVCGIIEQHEPSLREPPPLPLHR